MKHHSFDQLEPDISVRLSESVQSQSSPVKTNLAVPSPSTTALDLDQRLLDLKQQGLRRRRRVVESPQGPRLITNGRELLSFCSNDYLGLANHPALISAVRNSLEQYGVGSGASAMISGHTAAHAALETRLAGFVGLERALHFSTGYMANMAIIPALVGKDGTVFCDRLNHACIVDGAWLSGAELEVYPHLDMVTLEKRLARCTSPNKMVATDTVFSMDGDIAPIPKLLELCERYNAWLMLDDAHGFGVLGDRGQGSLAHFNVPYSSRIVYMGTLGKAAGVSGAFVAGAENVIEWLLQTAKPYVFSTSCPPMLAAAVMASLEIIGREKWRRERIRELILQLREGVTGLPWQLLHSDTAIQPLIVGDNHIAVRMMQMLEVRGIWVPAIRPPTVPKGTARLRISLSASHTSNDVAQLIDALRVIARMDLDE